MFELANHNAKPKSKDVESYDASPPIETLKYLTDEPSVADSSPRTKSGITAAAESSEKTTPPERKPESERKTVTTSPSENISPVNKRKSSTDEVEKDVYSELSEKWDNFETSSVEEKSDLGGSKPITLDLPLSTRFEKLPHFGGYRAKLFDHLNRTEKEHNLSANTTTIHPIVVQLGEQYSERIVVGCNARCIAFLRAMKTVIEDYIAPPQKEFSRGLQASIQNCVDYLQACRPLAVSCINAHKFITRIFTQLPTNRPDSQLKGILSKSLDNYKRDRIDKAAEAISTVLLREKIAKGDTILTFGCSSLITHILGEAHRLKVDFRVIVVDCGPFHEGQELMRRLESKGISCTCVLINAVGFVMPEVTKVLLGAHSVLANGYVMCRTGTAQVALVARSFNVPVLVCCETHKFSERCQTDAIVFNELGNSDDFINRSRLKDWQSFHRLYPLNLVYDFTPPELVTAVVSEVAISPSTSVPVILRIQPKFYTKLYDIDDM